MPAENEGEEAVSQPELVGDDEVPASDTIGLTPATTDDTIPPVDKSASLVSTNTDPNLLVNLRRQNWSEKIQFMICRDMFLGEGEKIYQLNPKSHL